MCVFVCVFSAVLMHLLLSSLHPHSLTTLFLFFFPLPLSLLSPQDTEPEQDSHGRSRRLQFVLHAALAVRPVCAAHSGK